jgi:hypothetical protein
MELESNTNCPLCKESITDKESQYEYELIKIIYDPMINKQKQKEKDTLLNKLYKQETCCCCRLRLIGFVLFYKT